MDITKILNHESEEAVVSQSSSRKPSVFVLTYPSSIKRRPRDSLSTDATVANLRGYSARLVSALYQTSALPAADAQERSADQPSDNSVTTIHRQDSETAGEGTEFGTQACTETNTLGSLVESKVAATLITEFAIPEAVVEHVKTIAKEAVRLTMSELGGSILNPQVEIRHRGRQLQTSRLRRRELHSYQYRPPVEPDSRLRKVDGQNMQQPEKAAIDMTNLCLDQPVSSILRSHYNALECSALASLRASAAAKRRRAEHPSAESRRVAKRPRMRTPKPSPCPTNTST